MFPGPGRTRPPMPPFPFGPGPFGQPPFTGPQQGPQQNFQQHPVRPHLMSMFQDENGQLDFNKIMGTANEVSKVYGQVKPLISKFMR